VLVTYLLSLQKTRNKSQGAAGETARENLVETGAEKGIGAGNDGNIYGKKFWKFFSASKIYKS
jgi:hypothetical protein